MSLCKCTDIDRIHTDIDCPFHPVTVCGRIECDKHPSYTSTKTCKKCGRDQPIGMFEVHQGRQRTTCRSCLWADLKAKRRGIRPSRP